MATVLVTGATGLIGLETVRVLEAQGHDVRALVRRPRRGALLRGLDVQPVQGDLTRPASLHRAVEGVDAVVHYAARATMEPLRVLKPTVVDGTRTLAAAAVEAGVRTFTYASSLLVHGEASAADPIDGDTPVDPQVDYGRAKVAAEEALTAVAAGTDMSVGTVRLPHVYGPGDLLFQRVRRGLLVTPGLGRNVYSHLHVRDAARLMAACAVEGWEGTSATADDEPVTWNRFWGIAGEHDANFRHLKAPAWLAKIGASVIAAVDPRRGPSLVTADTVTGWNLAQPVAPRLIWDDLGLSPQFPTVASGVPAVLDDSILFRWKHPVDDH